MVYGRLCHIAFDENPTVALCGKRMGPSPGHDFPPGPVCSRCSAELMRLYKEKV